MSETVVGNTEGKDTIASGFGRSALHYEEQAIVQKEVANRLIASLKPWRDILPDGPIMELGCGTGFVTEGLLHLYPDREIIATDLSSEMIEVCRNKFADFDNISFRIQDAEEPYTGDPMYAMTVCGFVAQWFKNPALTLGQWMEVTKPGGLLLASVPGNESFPEWKACCRELGLPFTGNALPDTEEMVVKLSTGPVQLDYYEDTITQGFEHAIDFFHNMKQIGAATQQIGRHLSMSEMKLLINHWDHQCKDDVKVSYHAVFLAIKRDFNS